MEYIEELPEGVLYRFTVPGANGAEEKLDLPVPNDEVLAFLATKTGATSAPQPILGPRAKWRWMTAGMPSRKDHAELYEALASLLDMQVTLLDSVAKAVEITPNLRLQYALACSIADLQQGHSLADAFARHPKMFDSAVVGQLAAAQKTAATARTLRAMSSHIEMIEKVRSQTLLSLLYPVGIISVLYVICSGILIFLMPKLTEAFASMQVVLNAPARMLVLVGRIVNHAPLALLIGPGIVAICWLVRTTISRPALAILRKLPIFGRHFTCSQLAISSATLASLLKSGILLHDAVGLVADTMGDPGAANAFRATKNSLEAGDKPPIAFRYVTNFFGREASSLRSAIEIGNEATSLPISLEQVATKYQRDFVRSSDVLGKVIEPLATLLVGFIVGAIVLTAYYPILSASANVK